MILYFGAEFTKAFAVHYGHEIHPNEYAVVAHMVEVEHENKSVQQAHEETQKIQEQLKECEPGGTIQLPNNGESA